MTNARIQYYLTVANEITPSSRNPYDLCKKLEIEIINNCALHKDAYFVCQEGLKLIFVNSCIKNRHRRKFVTAHEIGHYFLHQDKLYCCNNISEINLSSSIKVNSSSQDTKQIHLHLNMFCQRLFYKKNCRIAKYISAIYSQLLMNLMSQSHLLP